MSEPVATPVAAEVATQAGEGVIEAPSAAAADADASDYAAAMALLAGDSPAEPAADTLPVSAPAVPPVPAKAEPAPVAPNADLQVILAKIARLENERDEAASARDKHAGEAKSLSERAAKADRIAQLAADNPIALAQELGITPETLSDFLLNGPKKPDPALTELRKQQEAVAKQLEEIKSRETAALTEQRRAAFKADLRTKLTKDDYPLAHAVHGDDFVGEVFGVMQHMYAQNGGREPDFKVAAKAVEDTLAGIKAKLLAGATGPSKVTSPTTLTNQPTVSPRAAAQPDDEDAAYARAIAILQGKV